MTVQLEDHGTRAVGVDVTYGDQPDDEGLALLDVDGDPGTHAGTVEEGRGVQGRGVAVRRPMEGELPVDLREQNA